jgi:hypothetical protein
MEPFRIQESPPPDNTFPMESGSGRRASGSEERDFVVQYREQQPTASAPMPVHPGPIGEHSVQHPADLRRPILPAARGMYPPALVTTVRWRDEAAASRGGNPLPVVPRHAVPDTPAFTQPSVLQGEPNQAASGMATTELLRGPSQVDPVAPSRRRPPTRREDRPPLTPSIHHVLIDSHGRNDLTDDGYGIDLMMQQATDDDRSGRS